MNIEERIQYKLEVGLIVKNYKELCNIIEAKATKGKGRQYHIREFERYCTYSKEGHKFIVTEVFDEPLPKIDNRATGGNSKYDELMDKILINILLDHGAINKSYTKLMNDYFDFFTPEYNRLNKLGYTRYAEVNNMSKGLVMIYQQRINAIVKGCLETSLNRLKRNNIITYEQNIIVRDSDFSTSFADNKMVEKIKKYETKAYEEMDIVPFNRINPNVNNQFKSNVCESLEVVAYWNVYSLNLIDSDIKKVTEDVDELIKRFIKSIHSSVINRESTDNLGKNFKPYSSPKFEEDINTLEKMIWKLPDGYKSKYDEEQEIYDLLGGTSSNENESVPF